MPMIRVIERYAMPPIGERSSEIQRQIVRFRTRVEKEELRELRGQSGGKALCQRDEIVV